MQENFLNLAIAAAGLTVALACYTWLVMVPLLNKMA